MTTLRPYQQDLHDRTIAALLGVPEHEPFGACVVAPTGAGKTVITSALISALHGWPQAVIAHRQELVTQLSMSLARNGHRHGIVGSTETVRGVQQAHAEEFGRVFVDQRSPLRVCGIDTLVRMPEGDPWPRTVRAVHIDEGHHLLVENKWGKGVRKFPNARVFGYTATPVRGDGKGLGRWAAGLFDVLIEGPKMRDLIDAGYLTDYDVACPVTADLDLSHVPLAADGDYSRPALRAAVHQSGQLVGDVVDHYKRHALGKLGVTFAVDIEDAEKFARAFRGAGVPSEVVTGKTPDALRRHILRRFRRREILQLVNVDLFGEGFDLPAIECVSLARPTKSVALHYQQFGRALRLMVPPDQNERWGEYSDEERVALIAASEKPRALILDHVGNVLQPSLGLPDDRRRVWSLEGRERAKRQAPTDVIPLRRCLEPTCQKAYERHLLACPYCGEAVAPASNRTVEAVDGDLGLLDPKRLAELRGEAEAIDKPAKVPHGASYVVAAGIANRHREKQQAQVALREAMATWGAGQSALSRRPLTDREQAKAFYLAFGLDVLSAQALPRADAEALHNRVQAALRIDGIEKRAQDSTELNRGETESADYQ